MCTTSKNTIEFIPIEVASCALEQFSRNFRIGSSLNSGSFSLNVSLETKSQGETRRAFGIRI